MMNESNQDDAELFDSSAPEGDETSASTSDEAESELESTDQESEQIEVEENKDLVLEEDKKPSTTGDREMQKQIESWVGKIVNGSKNLEDIPAGQEWLKKHIEKKIAVLDKTPEIEELVERKFKEKEEQKKFDHLKNELNKAGLNKGQKEQLSKSFKKLRKDGLSKPKSLEYAMGLAKIDFDEIERNSLRESMRIPRQGGSSKGDPQDFEEHQRLPEKERVKRMEAIRRGDKGLSSVKT